MHHNSPAQMHVQEQESIFSCQTHLNIPSPNHPPTAPPFKRNHPRPIFHHIQCPLLRSRSQTGSAFSQRKGCRILQQTPLKPLPSVTTHSNNDWQQVHQRYNQRYRKKKKIKGGRYAILLGLGKNMARTLPRTLAPWYRKQSWLLHEASPMITVLTIIASPAIGSGSATHSYKDVLIFPTGPSVIGYNNLHTQINLDPQAISTGLSSKRYYLL